jgi:hypothetical protein
MATLRLLLVAALLALPLSIGWPMRAEGCVGPATPPSLQETIAPVDLIVVGTVGEILVLPPESVPDTQELFGRLPVEYKVAVDEYLKGSGATTLLVLQPSENIVQEAVRILSVDSIHTDCGYVRTTVGDHGVFLLKKADDIRYGAVHLRVADEMEVEDFIAQIRAAVAANATRLPPTGSGPPHHSAPVVLLAAASMLAGLGLAANAAFVLRRRSR